MPSDYLYLLDEEVSGAVRLSRSARNCFGLVASSPSIADFYKFGAGRPMIFSTVLNQESKVNYEISIRDQNSSPVVEADGSINFSNTLQPRSRWEPRFHHFYSGYEILISLQLEDMTAIDSSAYVTIQTSTIDQRVQNDWKNTASDTKRLYLEDRLTIKLEDREYLWVAFKRVSPKIEAHTRVGFQRIVDIDITSFDRHISTPRVEYDKFVRRITNYELPY